MGFSRFSGKNGCTGRKSKNYQNNILIKLKKYSAERFKRIKKKRNDFQKRVKKTCPDLKDREKKSSKYGASWRGKFGRIWKYT